MQPYLDHFLDEQIELSEARARRRQRCVREYSFEPEVDERGQVLMEADRANSH